jgi:hypothetical protein
MTHSTRETSQWSRCSRNLLFLPNLSTNSSSPAILLLEMWGTRLITQARMETRDSRLSLTTAHRLWTCLLTSEMRWSRLRKPCTAARWAPRIYKEISIVSTTTQGLTFQIISSTLPFRKGISRISRLQMRGLGLGPSQGIQGKAPGLS